METIASNGEAVSQIIFETQGHLVDTTYKKSRGILRTPLPVSMMAYFTATARSADRTRSDLPG